MKHLISEMKVILRWITCPAKIHLILHFVAIFYAWMKKFGHKDSKNTMTLLLQVVLLMARSYVTANIKWEWRICLNVHKKQFSQMVLFTGYPFFLSI